MRRAPVLLLALFALVSTAHAAGPLVPPVGARRDVEQLEGVLRPHLAIVTNTHKFFCLRLLPTTGEEAIVMVRSKSTVPYAERLLRVAGVDGTVELRSHRRWEAEMYRLAEIIRSEIPPALHGEVDPETVSPGVPEDFYECIDTEIELPLPKETSPAAEAWANSEIERYGYDRVTWRYEEVGVEL